MRNCGRFQMGTSHLMGGLVACIALSLSAQERDWEQEKFTSMEVRPGLYMLSGVGGNLALTVGRDGALLVDDDMAPMVDKLQAAIAELTDQPVRFIVNTHWHFDHVGGNKELGAEGAVIAAHRRVRERMADGQYLAAFRMEIPPAESIALPIVTFDQRITFHFNDDAIEVNYMPAAHTDGDSVVYFVEANVVHTGDLYWNGLYPLVDVESGGKMLGMIDGIAVVLSRIDDKTRVIPGHGPLSNKMELMAYYDMMKTVYERVSGLKSRGKSLEETIAAKPTAEFDARWGHGLFSPEQWLQVVYEAI